MDTSSLYKRLLSYTQKGYLPMHMPGHKRKQPDFLQSLGANLDITEIPGFDNLHDPQGILKDSMDRAAKIFHASCSRYLVASTTAGILSGMYALYRPGSTIVMARNCHVSVYHGAELLRAKSKYVYPAFDRQKGIYTALNPDEVQKVLSQTENPSMLVLTSPTYEGIVSDLKSIVRIAHRFQVPVLIDAAHGAHFGFASGFPESPLCSGADIVVQSLHKTLPSLTGTAIAHISKQATIEKFDHALSIFQTSSPSYLLLASIDGCVHWLETDGERALNLWSDQLDKLREQTKELLFCKIYSSDDFPDAYDFDKGKLMIAAKNGCSCGKIIYETLRRQFMIEPETATDTFCLLMTSPMDSQSDYQRLFRALQKIDKQIMSMDLPVISHSEPIKSQPVLPIAEALGESNEMVPLRQSVNRICAEYVLLFPPDCPILVPGEKITESHINTILSASDNDSQLQKTSNSAEILVTR